MGQPKTPTPQPPLTDDLIKLFQGELLFQCKVVLAAAADLKRTLGETAALDAQMLAGPGSERVRLMPVVMPRLARLDDETWMALQQLLSAAANMSKLLWGQGEQRNAVRQPLRSSIGVSESSPLKARDLRNDWEHIDERLEEWNAKSARHNIAYRGIGAGGVGAMVAGITEIEQFLHFDPKVGTVTFWGHAVSIAALIDEARAIQPRLEAALARR